MHRLPGRRNDPMGLQEIDKEERKIKGGVISVFFARTWSTTAILAVYPVDAARWHMDLLMWLSP